MTMTNVVERIHSLVQTNQRINANQYLHPTSCIQLSNRGRRCCTVLECGDTTDADTRFFCSFRNLSRNPGMLLKTVLLWTFF